MLGKIQPSFINSEFPRRKVWIPIKAYSLFWRWKTIFNGFAEASYGQSWKTLKALLPSFIRYYNPVIIEKQCKLTLCKAIFRDKLQSEYKMVLTWGHNPRIYKENHAEISGIVFENDNRRPDWTERCASYNEKLQVDLQQCIFIVALFSPNRKIRWKVFFFFFIRKLTNRLFSWKLHNITLQVSRSWFLSFFFFDLIITNCSRWKFAVWDFVSQQPSWTSRKTII